MMGFPFNHNEVRRNMSCYADNTVISEVNLHGEVVRDKKQIIDDSEFEEFMRELDKPLNS